MDDGLLSDGGWIYLSAKLWTEELPRLEFRPRPITMWPMRRVLFRGANVYQRSARYTCIQAQNSIRESRGGTPMSGR